MQTHLHSNSSTSENKIPDLQKYLNRIKNIKKITITDLPNEWENTQFYHINTLNNNITINDKRLIVLNDQQLINIGYFPSIIPESLLINMEKLLINKKPQTIISGTWNRYGKGIFEVKKSTEEENELLNKLNKIIEPFVMNLVKKLNKNMFNLLNKLPKNIKRFANYPSLALNILNEKTYDVTKKPYRKHADTNDSGMTVILYMGQFEGGELVIDLNNCEINIKRGDVVLLNTYLYDHYVKKIINGMRYGLVYFSGIDHFRIWKKDENNNKNILPELPYEKEDEELLLKRREVKNIKGNKKKKYLKQYNIFKNDDKKKEKEKKKNDDKKKKKKVSKKKRSDVDNDNKKKVKL
ncbi:hypothetical protein ABK040_008286 [Willaertia magna]